MSAARLPALSPKLISLGPVQESPEQMHTRMHFSLLLLFTPLHYLKQYPKLEHGTRAETLSRSISLDASRRQHQLPAELL